MVKNTLRFFSLLGVTILSICHPLVADNEASYQGAKTVYLQYQLEQEGKHLAQNGHYDEAIAKFKEALDPKYINYDFQKAFAIGSIVKILIWQEKYDEAIKRNKWFMEKKVTSYALEQEALIQALKEYKNSDDRQVIYNFINRLKKDHEKELPSKGYEQINGVSTIANIIRLYDTIGDSDAGIKFIDEILIFLRDRKKNKAEAYAVYDRIKTVDQAANCMKIGPKDNADWHGCKFLSGYLSVREAFEKDKADGTKGRATKALIQSDYFPW